MWVRESNKVLPDKTLSKEAWGGWDAPVLHQPLVGAVPPPERKGAQPTAQWGSGRVPGPGIMLGLCGWIRVGGVWEGTAQHSRGGKLQPDAHPGSFTLGKDVYPEKEVFPVCSAWRETSQILEHPNSNAGSSPCLGTCLWPQSQSQ